MSNREGRTEARTIMRKAWNQQVAVCYFVHDNHRTTNRPVVRIACL